MKIMISTLVWSNIDKRIVDSHKKVCEHFGIPVTYFYEDIHHGPWMDRIYKTYTEPDVYGFFDIDCVPIKAEALRKSLDLVKKGYLVGPAQATNCIRERYHLFASPAFFFISKDLYHKIGSPSTANNAISDTNQELTRHAEKQLLPYRYWMPTKFEREPVEGIWRLAGYGYYGIGTVYDNDLIYHLYQSRFGINAQLFSERCNEIVNGTFDSSNFYKSTEEYRGLLRIAEE